MTDRFIEEPLTEETELRRVLKRDYFLSFQAGVGDIIGLFSSVMDSALAKLLNLCL